MSVQKRQLAVPIEEHRREITKRTEAGEGCEQIAAGLRAQGVETSGKTISRYRIAWGLRKRAAGTAGRKYPDRKKREPLPSRPSAAVSRIKAQEQRKESITERTVRGETAEQIAAALQAQGVVLKSGASTIWRLQTIWGLVPYDKDRARGKGIYNKKKQTRAAAGGADVMASQKPERSSAMRPCESLSQTDLSEAVFYPSACRNGPHEATGSVREPLEDTLDYTDHFASYMPEIRGTSHPPVDTCLATSPDPAPHLIRAELLVDLAGSMLAAAYTLKELYLAQQTGEPAPGTNTGLPPTEEDVEQAKAKVREAASVLRDLTLRDP